MHQGVNRVGDSGFALPDGTTTIVGVNNEWAAKAGIGYRIEDWFGPLQLYAMYESIWRVGAIPAFNQRSKNDFC